MFCRTIPDSLQGTLNMQRWTSSAFVLFLAVTSQARAADWPQWRGTERNGTSKETGLLQEWPKEGPKLRWKAPDIGTGYSTPAIVKGHVYVQTTRGQEERAVALDEKTGGEVWSVPIGSVGPNRG